jgi:Ca2+-binding EF-hand superfamily protein
MRFLRLTSFGIATCLVACLALAADKPEKLSKEELKAKRQQELQDKANAKGTTGKRAAAKAAKKKGAQQPFDLTKLPPDLQQKILDEFDADGDGKLDAKEQAAAKAMAEKLGFGGAPDLDKAQQKMLERFDTNGDGTLDAEEQAAAQKEAEKKVRGMADKLPPAMKAQLMQQLQKQMKQFDADGDGKLSPEEMEKAKEAMKNFKGLPGGRPDRTKK